MGKTLLLVLTPALLLIFWSSVGLEIGLPSSMNFLLSSSMLKAVHVIFSRANFTEKLDWVEAL